MYEREQSRVQGNELGAEGFGIAVQSIAAKQCSRCRETKSIDKFHRNRKARDGRKSECAKCSNEWSHTYRQTHAEMISAKMAEYRSKNRHVVWEAEYRTRCGKYRLTPVIASFTRECLVDRWGDACVYCSTGPFEQIDHRLPVAAGGPHTVENVVPVCKGCNEAKRQAFDMPAISEFRARVLEVIGILASRGESVETDLIRDDDGLAT